MISHTAYPHIYLSAHYAGNGGSIEKPPTAPTKKQDTERTQPEFPTKEQPHHHVPEKMPQ